MRPLATSTLLLALLALTVLPAGGCQTNEPVTLALYSPAEMCPNAKPAQGPGGESAIEVRANAGLGTTTVAVCDKPAIASPDYVLRGRVKYEGVVGGGYLELLNDFGYRGTYFTRSLDNDGPMATVSGTSDWRDFELPFHAEPGMNPQRLTLNVALPGPGTVTVTVPLVVTPLNLTGEWWNNRQARLIAVGLTVFFLILGALFCVSIVWGKSRRLTLSLCGIGLATGGVSLLAGLAALAAGQPWYVCCPLLGVGFIGLTVFGFNLPTIARRSQADEFRRMTAADVV
ncbi:MAG TPA: hypothetical protein VHY91_23875 [Pirellulales bacterium]|jgi:hypothetical protein|nr:hypothetical protein [Pirellulales bacterium]